MKRSDLIPGDLIFTTPKSLWGRLIAREQKIGYSHCCFVTEWHGIVMISESEIFKGVYCSDLMSRLEGEKVTVMRPSFRFNKAMFNYNAHDKIGCKYDTRGIINQLIKEWTGLWLDKNQADNDKSFYCVKYYGYAMSKASHKYHNYNQIDLNDVYRDWDMDHIFTGVLE